MDRGNGGDPLAPPRPPKLLPRVHRPRAPEPAIMNGVVAATTATSSGTTTPAIPQRNNNNNNQQHSSSGCISSSSSNSSNSSRSNNNNLSQQQQQQLHSITSTTTTTNLHSNNNSNSNNSRVSTTLGGGSNNNNNSNVAVITTTQPEIEDYQIHHLTFLPQRPSSLSRTGSHVSSGSSSSSITAANSFTRRRPPPPTPGAAVPLLTIAGGSGSSTSSSLNFLSHFQSAADAAPTSPVTLAQPRPDSERLTNEYVDTPLRAAAVTQQLQLQHATRAQHPAGQHDNGATTHHLLLLPQRELRLQQQQHHPQQQQQQQQHSNRLAGTAGSATATATTTSTDGTDGFLHSHQNHQLQHQHNKAPTQLAPAAVAAAGKFTPTPPPPPRGCNAAQPITQPITKQPASSVVCKFAKEHALPLDELLELHHTSAGGIATVNSGGGGPSPLGAPIVIGGDPVSLNPITCPRCDRCRCEQCQSPRPLPQTWVCNKTCLCSAESVIDYASCLCCAKALFYHCARDNDLDCDDGSGTPCVDNPCSCGPYKRTQRWGWLGALSLVLPCLWCYWPMRGCVSLCEKCYGRYAGRGCRCQQIGSTSSMLPIVELGLNSNSAIGSGAGGGHTQNNGTAGSHGASKSVSHHYHLHSECSTASRILRKGDLTPEKRLLDSSPEY